MHRPLDDDDDDGVPYSPGSHGSQPDAAPAPPGGRTEALSAGEVSSGEDGEEDSQLQKAEMSEEKRARLREIEVLMR